MIELRIIIEQREINVVDVGVFNRKEDATTKEKELCQHIEESLSALAYKEIEQGGKVIERRYRQ